MLSIVEANKCINNFQGGDIYSFSISNFVYFFFFECEREIRVGVAGRRNDSAPLSLNYFGALAGTCVRYGVMDDALGNPPRLKPPRSSPPLRDSPTTRDAAWIITPTAH